MRPSMRCLAEMAAEGDHFWFPDTIAVFLVFANPLEVLLSTAIMPISFFSQLFVTKSDAIVAGLVGFIDGCAKGEYLDFCHWI